MQAYLSKNAPSPEVITRPSITNEFKAALQPLKLLGSLIDLIGEKPGNGQKIMLFPGWMSHQNVMYPVKQYLNHLGYDAQYWGLGYNNGSVEEYRDYFIDQMLSEGNTHKYTLIGWSLGGVIAREIAREIPNKVAGVITYGTPVIDGPKHTIAYNIWGKEETNRLIDLLNELNKTNPIKVPITSIFTKNDSIVTWSACIDHDSKNVNHYEVDSTHFSLGIDPNVWKIIINHLKKYG